MVTANNNIHVEIASELDRKMEEAKKEIDETVQKVVRDTKDKILPATGPVFEKIFKDIRSNAIVFYETTKLWLPGRISRAINESVEVTTIHKLQELSENLYELDKNKKNAEAMQKQISDQQALPDYEKFQLYGDVKKKKSVTASSESILSTTGAATKAYETYVSKRNVSFIMGLIVTILCTAADYSIIYAFFQASNVTVTSSIITSIIFAACLDAPPYVLGSLWTKRDDSKRLWYLRNESDSSGLSAEVKRYNFIMILSVTIFLILFALYFSVRMITFLGGGDFNLALHAFFDKNLTFENSVFTSADILTILTPLGTSAVAFAVGMMLFSPYTDYVKNCIVSINNNLALEKKKYREKIISYDTECQKLNSAIEHFKNQIWTYYAGQIPIPKSEREFRQKISAEFHKFNVSLYRQTYETCSTRIRDAAELSISDITRVFASYAKEPNKVMSTPLTNEDKKRLDNIWVRKEGESQTITTLNDMEKINKLIDEVSTRLDSKN